MSIFKEYGETFEKKFAHDEYLRFKATARRNRLLGQWAAAQMGKQGSAAEAYANAVVEADFEEVGDRDVIAKLQSDFQACGMSAVKLPMQKFCWHYDFIPIFIVANSVIIFTVMLSFYTIK